MNEKDIQEIKKIYISLCDASIYKDLETLDKILDESYILVHITGMKQTKKEYINSVRNGELEYYEAIHEKIDVEINQNKAHLVGMTKTLASPFGINKSWWNLKQEIDLEKKNDNWTIIYSIVSTY